MTNNLNIFLALFLVLIGQLSPSLSKDLGKVLGEISVKPDNYPAQTPVQVIRIVDGDTLVVNLNNKEQKLRLANINAPESVSTSIKPQCMGKEASRRLGELVTNHTLKLELDPSQKPTDKYGRLIRYVFLEDGTDVGLTLIKEGLAESDNYSKKHHPYFEIYEQAQTEAQENSRGLWDKFLCPIKKGSPL